MSFKDGMSGSQGGGDLKLLGYYTTIDDLVRVLEDNEVEVSRRNCRANTDFSRFSYACVERAENRWPNCPFNVLAVQDDFGNFSVYSSGEHVHATGSCRSDESDQSGSVLSESDGYVGSPSESDGNGRTEACEAIVISQETNPCLVTQIANSPGRLLFPPVCIQNAYITATPQVDLLVGISRNLPASSPAAPSTEGQSSSQANKSDYHLFAKCNSNSDVNPILLRNHVMYSHQSGTGRTTWKCGPLTHNSSPAVIEKTHVGSGRLANGCDFSILQQTHQNGTILLYRRGEHNCGAYESLPSQSTSAANNSRSSRQALKRVIAASNSISLSHVPMPPTSAIPSSRRPVDHMDDSTSPLRASPYSTPLSIMAKRKQQGKTLAEVNQFLSERRLCWSSTFDDGATRIYSCRAGKCPNEVEIKLAHGKYTVEERGEHYHPAPENPTNHTRRSTLFNHADRNGCEEIPNTEDMVPAGSIGQSGTTSSAKHPNSANDGIIDGDAGTVSLDMHEVNSAHPNEPTPVEVEDGERMNVPQGPVSEAGAELQNENQPPEVIILSSDEEKSVDHGSDSDGNSTTTASIDEEPEQSSPVTPTDNSAEGFRLSDKLPQIEEMAESMGLEIVDEGDTVMVMANEDGVKTTGRWLIFKDADGDEVEVAEFVKRVFVRKQTWAKRGWDEFRIQFHNTCADHFMNNDK